MKTTDIKKKIEIKELTLECLQEKLNEGHSVMELLEYLQGENPHRFNNPEKPKKPSINYSHTSIEAKQYAKDLEIWEELIRNYEKEKEVWREKDNEINLLMRSFIIKESGLDKIPEQVQEKVWRKAYEDSNSAGYYEVYQNLNELVDLFD